MYIILHYISRGKKGKGGNKGKGSGGGEGKNPLKLFQYILAGKKGKGGKGSKGGEVCDSCQCSHMSNTPMHDVHMRKVLVWTQ